VNRLVEDHMTERIDTGWSVREFEGLDLGDARLNRRLLIMAEAFGVQPQAPINQASADWQDTKAAYAFFANPQALPAEILLPHQQRTLERMAAHPLVLAIQDTTFLNYTHHPATSGLGPIGGGQRGLLMHSTLAVTPQGLPLGLLDQQIWARPEPDKPAKRAKQRPIADKESHKWLTPLRESVSMTPSEIRLVTIANREADIFEFLADADELQAEYVIRAAQDRRLSGEVALLWAHMAKQQVVGTVTVEVAARPGKPARQADLCVRVARVTLQPPLRPADDAAVWMEPLTIWAIFLHEDTPPQAIEPLDWLLLTSVPIEAWQDVTERIGWYCLRPQIEAWHKILKSGCTIEDCRLEDAERLKPYVTLMGIIAWRLFWLTHINRQTPDAPCTTILADHEWKALYSAIHRTPDMPTTVPSVRQAVHWIAQLGGFLGRKGDGEPGITTIWRGWSRLADMANLYLIMHPSEDTGNS
jgi:Transposase DNA-binding/Transposase Tn5 dimerisation domain